MRFFFEMGFTVDFLISLLCLVVFLLPTFAFYKICEDFEIEIVARIQDRHSTDRFKEISDFMNPRLLGFFGFLLLLLFVLVEFNLGAKQDLLALFDWMDPVLVLPVILAFCGNFFGLSLVIAQTMYLQEINQELELQILMPRPLEILVAMSFLRKWVILAFGVWLLVPPTKKRWRGGGGGFSGGGASGEF